MSNINELLTSIVLYCLVSYILQLPNLFTGLLFAAAGSQISTILPYNYKNTLAVPLAIISFVGFYPNVCVPLAIGCLSSLLIALLSKNGCKLLYPFKKTTFTGPNNYLENDSKGDYAATTFLLALAFLSIAFSAYGMDIVDDISQNNDFGTYFNTDDHMNNSTPESVQYVNINPADCLNMNITTTHYGNTTTTIISPYNTS